MRRAGIFTLAMLPVLAWSIPAEPAPLSVRDSFRIGTSGSSYCSAQPVATDAALTGMFDVGYSITCRDAALPIGKVYQIRSGDPSARLAAERAKEVTCGAPRQGTVQDIGTVDIIDCKMTDADVAYRVYQFKRGAQYFSAEGLAGYDSALELALRSVVADKPVDGEVSIATTGAGDPASFARVQAGTLDPTRALAEAYRRNNVGSYADAAEFFAAVSSAGNAPISRAEALVNEALQKSNLGRFAEADALFTRAEEQVRGEPIDSRRLRNYRAMHLLNQQKSKEALKELDKPVASLAKAVANGNSTAAGIDQLTAQKLNAEASAGGRLGDSSDDLTVEEKAEILDGQALQLRGTSLRLGGDFTGAKTALQSAEAKLEGVRDGRVASIAWMRAQIVGDLAAISEDTNDVAGADKLYRQGVEILQVNYPGSAALLNSRARLAGFLARTGQIDAA